MYESFPSLGIFIFQVREANTSLYYFILKWFFLKQTIRQLLKIKKKKSEKHQEKKVDYNIWRNAH